MQVGDKVQVLEPFNIAFPDTYTVTVVKPDGTCTLETGADFDPIYLTKVTN